MLLTKSCWLIQIRAYLLLEVYSECTGNERRSGSGPGSSGRASARSGHGHLGAAVAEAHLRANPVQVRLRGHDRAPDARASARRPSGTPGGTEASAEGT
jgi:hypothetical protein